MVNSDDTKKNQTGMEGAELREDRQIGSRLRDLEHEDLEHLSLNTEIVDRDTVSKADMQDTRDSIPLGHKAPDPVKEDVKQGPAAGEDVRKKQLRSAVGALENKKLQKQGLPVGILKNKWVAVGGGVLVLGLLLLSILLPRLSPRGMVGFPVGNDGATPTPTEASVSGSIIAADALRVDQDGDSIPDALETELGYDPMANDCVRNVGCGDFPTLPRSKLRLNLVFILDASGSMGEEVDGVRKWESAVEALENVVDQGFPRFTEIGMIVYGHRGSSSANDQAVSCNGVEVLQELETWGATEIEQVTGSLGPRGWTPLGKALEMAGTMLAGREGEGNFVVVLSDGQETCGGDPVESARSLHEAGIEVTTNVVGLVVSETERTQLEAIASAGGGQYYPADDSVELERALYLSSEAIRLWEEINQCIVNNLSAYGQCINLQYLQAINKIKESRLAIEEEAALHGASGQVIDPIYVETERNMQETFRILRNDNWDQYVEDLEGLSVGAR